MRRSRRRGWRSGRLWRVLLRLLRHLVGRLVGCWRGRHEPSRHRARWRAGFWHSRCRNCGVAMLRLGKGRWVVEGDEASRA